MADKIQLHPSGLNMLYRCGVQYDYRYNQGIKIPPAVTMVVGTQTHKTVEMNLNSKIEKGELLPTEQIADAAATGMTEAWDTQEIAIDEDDKTKDLKQIKGESIDKTVRLSVLHAENLAPTLEPKAVERKWVLELPNYPFDLAGTIDIEEINGVIRDTKTAGKSPSADAADVSEQLSIYGMAKQVIDGEPPPLMYLDVLVDNKTPIVKTLETTRDKDQNMRTLSRMERAMQIIEKGAFTPAPADAWFCSRRFCGYHAICHYASGKRK
jgi:hypothetical protein